MRVRVRVRFRVRVRVYLVGNIACWFHRDVEPVADFLRENLFARRHQGTQTPKIFPFHNAIFYAPFVLLDYHSRVRGTCVPRGHQKFGGDPNVQSEQV